MTPVTKNTHAAKARHTKKSSVRHTRAIQRDRSKRPLVGPPDEQIKERLSTLVCRSALAGTRGSANVACGNACWPRSA